MPSPALLALPLLPPVAAGVAVLATSHDSLPSWAQYGVIGLVLLGLLVTKTLVPGWIYAEKATEAAELRTENRELVGQVIAANAQAIPALQAAANAIDEALIELRRQERGRP